TIAGLICSKRDYGFKGITAIAKAFVIQSTFGFNRPVGNIEVTAISSNSIIAVIVGIFMGPGGSGTVNPIFTKTIDDIILVIHDLKGIIPIVGDGIVFYKVS